MKKVLIVDDEKLFLSSLSEGLRQFANEFQTLTAENGRQAVLTLETEEIDLLVTDLRMPRMDGFELIAYVSKNFPNLPIIVITAFGTDQIENKIKDFTIGYIEKPIDFQNFVEQIRIVLAEIAFGSFQGITLLGFLQLIEIERKSCTVIVESNGRVGAMYFISGKFVGAEMENLSGTDAAYEILNWENVKIDVGSPPRKADQKVSLSITNLLLDAAKARDESNLVDEDISFEQVLLETFEENPSAAKRGDSVKINSKATLTSLPTNERALHFLNENVQESLRSFFDSEDVLCASLFDLSERKSVARIGGENLSDADQMIESIASFYAAEIKLIEKLDLQDKIEEIVINLRKQRYLVRQIHPANQIFAFLILTQDSNLTLARFELKKFTEQLLS
jgi:DNA-binding response OmpR family regulator/predicted regulator of Ras-like GTPase activity (Roadblock/LC7/MglB family)